LALPRARAGLKPALTTVGGFGGLAAGQMVRTGDVARRNLIYNPV
jgi:hypothetical protein